jgi:sugar phosphate isomerase/epimerase
VHDNFGNPVYHTEKLQTHQIPFGKGDSHMPVGWGAIPFRDIFAEFIDNYDGMLICELRSRYFEQTRESANALVTILDGLGAGSSIAELAVS